jgi:hypothetical protein
MGPSLKSCSESLSLSFTCAVDEVAQDGAGDGRDGVGQAHEQRRLLLALGVHLPDAVHKEALSKSNAPRLDYSLLMTSLCAS